MSKNWVISGPYFPVFSQNTGKYGSEITPYLDTFHAVLRPNNVQYLLLVVQPEKEESFIQKLFFEKCSFPVPKKDLSQ